MREDFVEILAVRRHPFGARLAHPDAVTAAVDVKYKEIVFRRIGDFKGR